MRDQKNKQIYCYKIQGKNEITTEKMVDNANCLAGKQSLIIANIYITKKFKILTSFYLFFFSFSTAAIFRYALIFDYIPVLNNRYN